jgi:hypothetical protein
VEIRSGRQPHALLLMQEEQGLNRGRKDIWISLMQRPEPRPALGGLNVDDQLTLLDHADQISASLAMQRLQFREGKLGYCTKGDHAEASARRLIVVDIRAIRRIPDIQLLR